MRGYKEVEKINDLIRQGPNKIQEAEYNDNKQDKWTEGP